jgi:hypothetical protein
MCGSGRRVECPKIAFPCPLLGRNGVGGIGIAPGVAKAP